MTKACEDKQMTVTALPSDTIYDLLNTQLARWLTEPKIHFQDFKPNYEFYAWHNQLH